MNMQADTYYEKVREYAKCAYHDGAVIYVNPVNALKKSVINRLKSADAPNLVTLHHRNVRGENFVLTWDNQRHYIWSTLSGYLVVSPNAAKSDPIRTSFNQVIAKIDEAVNVYSAALTEFLGYSTSNNVHMSYTVTAGVHEAICARNQERKKALYLENRAERIENRKDNLQPYVVRPYKVYYKQMDRLEAFTRSDLNRDLSSWLRYAKELYM